MKINRRLNLVVPVHREKDVIYVHAVPISAEVFEANFLTISRTFASIYGLGLGPTAGPRVAAMLLKKTGKDMGLENETQGLISEMRRLSNVVVPTNAGWETIPLQDALDKNLIEGDDASEVENAITFFTVLSWMHRRDQLTQMLDEAVKLSGAQLESLNCTEYAASLRTSSADENTGETVAVSLPPR